MAPHRRCGYRLGSAIVVVVGVLADVGSASAALPHARLGSQRATTPPHVSGFDTARHIDANRVNMFTTNFGSFAWDISTGNAGLVWPRGTNQTAVFASGLWLGCQIGGETRVAVAEYSQEFGPGGMVSGTFDDPNRPEHRTYKVVRWTGNPADSEHVDRSPAELAADPLLDPLAHHAWSEYLAGAKPFGAPTRIYRLPNTSTLQPDDSVDVEGPDVMGDQMLWEVHNDADPALHTNSAGQTPPLGVEVQQTTFAFDRPNDLGNIVFLRFRILNKGANTLDQLYVSLWSDPDLGGPADDLVGCDVGRALGFAYNAAPSDAIYGTPPPAVGYVLLRGATDPASGTPLGLTAFSRYINGTDPTFFAETYNYMQGLLPDGSPLINPVTGLPTPYFVPGDPVTGQGWLDINPSDRRMLLTSGPTQMLPGQTQEIWAAIVVGRGGDNLASVGTVRCLADLARSAFQQDFSPLPNPASACSTATAMVGTNCPRPASYWGLECAAGGTGQLSGPQLEQMASFVNNQSTLFDWPSNTLAQFCATVSPSGIPDLRQQARSEFAAFLANYSGSTLDLSIGGGQRIFLNPLTSISCPPLRATTIGELAATTVLAPAFTDAAYLNNDPTHRRALEGVNFGLPYFGGGAGEGNDLFGSTLTTLGSPDSFKTVEIRFSHTATQKCYRYLRLQKADGTAPAIVGRGYPYSGFYDCNFQVWDVANNVQLDAAFVEKGLVIDDNGTLAPDTSTTIPSMDQTWDPSDDLVGDREYLFVFNRPYGSTPKDELRLDDTIDQGGFPVLYVLTAKLRLASDVIDDGDAFRFQWGRPPSPGADSLMVDLESQSLADPSVQASYQHLIDCLSPINAGVGIGQTCSSGPTPTLVSLVSAEAGVDQVTLRWYCGEAGLAASVERQVEGGEWLAVGTVASDGDGMLVFEDRDVVAGARYDYQLAIVTGGAVQHLGETHVEVPAQSVLAFLGTRPNPGDGRFLLAFSLATREPARIEVMDIAGRRMLTRDLTGLVPGSHVLALDERARFPAGIYLVRIGQGTRRVTGKAAIVR